MVNWYLEPVAKNLWSKYRLLAKLSACIAAVYTSQKLNACCVSHTGDMHVKHTKLKEKMQVHSNVMGLHACACAKGIRHSMLIKS